ncbi:MAG TPA: HU family DNA-binding protein [Gemmatimonadales bacterium]|nr:HU family DNA-binding protein [Gemmatimonadales bacterium]
MKKSELVTALAARAKLTKSDAARAVEALFSSAGIIAQELRKGGKVLISGFGGFEARRRSARRGRDPRTGREIAIGASIAPVFRPGRGLKAALDRRQS